MPEAGATEWAVGTAGFELSPGSFSPSAGGEMGRQHVLLPCHHLLPKPAGYSSAGESIKATTCMKDRLLKARRAPSQDTS